MAQTSLHQRFGDLDLPAPAPTAGETLAILDRGRAVLTALFAAAINAEFGAAWHAMVDGLPATHPLSGTDPVEDTLELEPSTSTMQQRKASWPLLCVHRTGEATYDQASLQEERLTQEWGVHYVLSPIDVGDIRRFGDICVAVCKLIRLVVRKKGHPSYQGGAIQFGADAGGFSTAQVESHQGPGQASFAGDDSGPLYYAVSLKLVTTEVSSDDLDAFGNLDAVDFSIGVGNATEIVPDLIQADTSIPDQQE
jgi:hypothetical protein